MIECYIRLKGVERLIDMKQYFVIHAARQSGKTTCLEKFADECKDFINFTKSNDDDVCREIEFAVNLRDHSIVDWKKKNGRSGYLFCNGIYTLLDDNDVRIKEISGRETIVTVVGW
ncbi:MAG: hypothetical protein LBD59_01355 [Prevotellaceae bacterium]|jgi:hypothetical protein|nr:hypothetical protein [Prevotellaceae bacterium]